MSSLEIDFDISDDALRDSEYDGGSDSASQLLRPFIPLGASPQNTRRQPQPRARQRSILSERDLGSSKHYYVSSVCFPCICFYYNLLSHFRPRTLVTWPRQQAMKVASTMPSNSTSLQATVYTVTVIRLSS